MGKQLGRQTQTHSTEAHLHPWPIGSSQAVEQVQRQGSGLTAHQTEGLFRQPPVHGEIERAAQQKQAACIGRSGALHVVVKRFTKRPINIVPTEIAHPDQRGTQCVRQLSGCRRDISQQQRRLSPGADPLNLPPEQIRQILIQLCQSAQRGGRIRSQGIGLHHPHIPSTTTLQDCVVIQQSGQEARLDGGTHHKRPVRSQLAELLKHSRVPCRMAKTMAAAAGVDQHTRDSFSGRRSW